jgi:hypothetical protein
LCGSGTASSSATRSGSLREFLRGMGGSIKPRRLEGRNETPGPTHTRDKTDSRDEKIMSENRTARNSFIYALRMLHECGKLCLSRAFAPGRPSTHRI